MDDNRTDWAIDCMIIMLNDVIAAYQDSSGDWLLSLIGCAGQNTDLKTWMIIWTKPKDVQQLPGTNRCWYNFFENRPSFERIKWMSTSEHESTISAFSHCFQMYTLAAFKLPNQVKIDTWKVYLIKGFPYKRITCLTMTTMEFLASFLWANIVSS